MIPPQCAEQPVRLTIRQLRPDQVLFLPPLSEGEALASRIIQVSFSENILFANLLSWIIKDIDCKEAQIAQFQGPDNQ